MTKTQTRIEAIGLVIIPATDQDRSIEFYVESLGFEKRTDLPFGGSYRWVEVYPPSGTTGIALAPPRPGDADGGADRHHADHRRHRRDARRAAVARRRRRRRGLAHG